MVNQKPSTVYSWIAEGRTYPRIHDIEVIAKALNTTCEYLIAGNENFIKSFETLKDTIEFQKEMIREMSDIIVKLK